jgi:hypothetical protein
MRRTEFNCHTRRVAKIISTNPWYRAIVALLQGSLSSSFETHGNIAELGDEDIDAPASPKKD